MTVATTSFELSIVISAPPERVYEALTDPKLHAAFTGARASGKPLPGSRFTAWDGYIEGRYLELEPPSRIVQQWSTTEWPEGAPPSRVEFRLLSVPGGTELKLLHSEVPVEQAESYRQGWIEYYWQPLRRYFGG